MANTIKVIPYDSAAGQMLYDLVQYEGSTPELLGRMNDVELASQVAIFLEAFIGSGVEIPKEMTTVEFHNLLVSFGIFTPTKVRATIYARMHRFGLRPVRKAGRTSYFSRIQFVRVVKENLPKAYDAMEESVARFGRIYSVVKRSIV